MKTTISLLILAAACGGNGGSSAPSNSADTKLASDIVAKQKGCKVYEGPSANPANDTIQDEFDRCLGTCVLAASCEELKDVECADSPQESNLLTCAKKCPAAPKDGFECADGTKIPRASVCDGDQNCASAEDEDGCDGYTCANGEKLSNDEARCDQIDDCSDGSDETGCANLCS